MRIYETYAAKISIKEYIKCDGLPPPSHIAEGGFMRLCVRLAANKLSIEIE